MLKVLFVDDEPQILSSLRRMLKRNCPDCELQFCTSGQEALTLLATQPFDVIFSDMRMPQMSGVEFLNQAQQQHPNTVRVAFSGYMEKEMVFDSVASTHAFLAKPATDDEIIQLIQRFGAVLNVINSKPLQSQLASISSLPVLPLIYQQLTDALSDEESSIQTLGEIVNKDVALCAKLLQLSNSAYFGIPRQCISIDEAVRFLGTDTLQHLVLGIKLFEALCHPTTEQMLTTIWKRAQVVTGVVRKIALTEQLSNAQLEVLTSASLLQDIGEIVLLTHAAQQTDSASEAPHGHPTYQWSLFGPSTVKTLEAEQLAGQNDHTDIGVYLLSIWGIPIPVITCIAHQHRLNRFTERPPSLGRYLLAANAIVEAKLKCGDALHQLSQHQIFSEEKLQQWSAL